MCLLGLLWPGSFGSVWSRLFGVQSTAETIPDMYSAVAYFSRNPLMPSLGFVCGDYGRGEWMCLLGLLWPGSVEFGMAAVVRRSINRRNLDLICIRLSRIT